MFDETASSYNIHLLNVALVVRNLPAIDRDMGLIPGLERSSGGGNGNVL